MNLVAGAMRRPITVLILILGVVLAAAVAAQRMPRDTFPDMGVPVIYVAQPYGGMDPAQMEGFLVNYYEYHFLYITGIEHVESKSIQGIALIKLQFHPGTNMAQAMAETVLYVNRSRAFMPVGTVPPFVMRFDAGSIPVGDLVFTSATRTVAEMQDLALFRVRPLFATLPGVSAPPPFGASQRSVVVRVDPERLRAYSLTPEDVVSAIGSANTISPSGNVRIGDMMPMVPINSVVSNVKELESIPIRMGSLQTVYLRDLGAVQDAADIQTGYALVNGRRTVFIPVTKRADASTLSVVNLVQANLPKFQAVLPDDVKVSYEFDQSPYVKRAIRGLMIEGALGALLTGLMVLLFLRDWRSVFVVVVNIPLSLLAALLALWIGGQTINIMTLGGLALAVGILVDEATVTVENIHTHLAGTKARRHEGTEGSPLVQPSVARAALDASNETAVPRLLAMLCVLAVFVPSLFMVGPARAMFVPLSLAVGFSMAASYLLSSTLVPVLSTWLLRGHAVSAHGTPSAFARFQTKYGDFLSRIVGLRWPVAGAYVALSVAVVVFIGRQLGTEIFPAVDASQFQLKLRAPTGTRIERTEALALQTLDTIGHEVGPGNIDVTLGFVGVQPPQYPINSIHLWTGGPEEAVLQVQLKRGAARIEPLKERLRRRLPEQMPGVRFSFEPGDIVSRVMSFGAPAPIQIDVTGPNLPANRAHAEKLYAALKQISSLRDIDFAQAMDYPAVQVIVDRERAGTMGVSTAQIARSLLDATSSSRFVVPIFWADPNTGIGYQIQVEVPQAAMNSIEEIRNVPIAGPDAKADPRDASGAEAGARSSHLASGASPPILLRSVAEAREGRVIGEFDRYNMQRMVSLTANISGESLGSVAGRIARAIASAGDPPPRVNVTLRGQVQPMEQMLGGLRTGLLLAIIVISLLLAANFQSVRLALAVISAVPAVMAGVVLMLWLTGTTLNVQSFMGATMAVGIAVANAILLVTFSQRSRAALPSLEAAVDGARSRLRPILMTSLAMTAGMVPMGLGLGEGGEQTAPLGRAVIGGLAAATLATLLVVPCVFAIVQGRRIVRSASLHPDDLTQS